MTSRRRFLISVTGGKPDRFFRYEHGAWPQTAERWRAEAGTGAEGIQPYDQSGPYFGMDPLVRITINSGYTDSPYYPKFSERTLEETEKYRICVDADGVTKKELSRNRETSMPQFIRFPVSDRADWDLVRTRLNPDDADERIGDVQALARLCSEPEVPTVLPMCGAYGHPRNLLGEEGLAYVLYDDPGLLEGILDNWLALYRALLERLTGRVRVDALLLWEDMCYSRGPLIDPEHFRRFMLPRYKQLIRFAKSSGIRAVMVDTDGDCRKMIPLFLEAGVDCLMPFEVQAGMDVVAIAKDFPGLSIMGGLDKRLLTGDSREAIKAEVDRVLAFFLERGGYIPTLDHTVPPNVPLASYRYYLHCVRSFEGRS